MNSESYEKLLSEYQGCTDGANEFCNAIVSQIKKLLEDNSLKLGTPIEARIKEWDSIVEKVDRKKYDLMSILDVPDLVGIRLVFLFHRDALTACEVLRGSFKFETEENTSERLADNEFGYGSRHYNIKINKDWAIVPTFSGLEKYQAEVQIRTVAQHNWAATSHALQYKKKENVPSDVRRSIYRVAALLELVDLEFERVLEERINYVDNIKRSEFLDEMEIDSTIVEYILKETLPSMHYVEGDDYSSLVLSLRENDIITVQQLKDLISSQLKETLKNEHKLISTLAQNDPIYIQNVERIGKGVFYTHVGLVLNMLNNI